MDHFGAGGNCCGAVDRHAKSETGTRSNVSREPEVPKKIVEEFGLKQE